jgi:ElaB/YqjD/DUF883 family membrane-anchored ribosome-binding protein
MENVNTEENSNEPMDTEKNIKESIDKASDYAHGAVDKIADMSYQAAEVLGEKGEQLKTAEQELVESYRNYIRECPIKSVGIAVAAGFLLSRLMNG